jgi:hypothetical protein
LFVLLLRHCLHLLLRLLLLLNGVPYPFRFPVPLPALEPFGLWSPRHTAVGGYHALRH